MTINFVRTSKLTAYQFWDPDHCHHSRLNCFASIIFHEHVGPPLSNFIGLHQWHKNRLSTFPKVSMRITLAHCSPSIQTAGTFYRLFGDSRQSPKGNGRGDDIIVSFSQWMVFYRGGSGERWNTHTHTQSLLKQLNSECMFSLY